MLSVNKKIILSITDKIQPSIRRTIIKGKLVWGGGTLIFSYIHRLGAFLGFKIFNLTILGVFRKMNMFGVWIFFWGHHKIGLYLGVISMYFRVFS